MNNNKPSIYGRLCSLYYDLQEKYAGVSEVDFYASFIKTGDRVLEAMVGSGRLLIPLLQQGYTLDGVDNSPSMLARCRERCKEFKLVSPLYEQSLEELALGSTYNVVIIAMGPFQLIADKALALQALQKIHAHMATGGVLLIDMFVPDVIDTDKRSAVTLRIDNNTELRFASRYFFYEKEQYVEALCTYELLKNGFMYAREEELMQFTWYTDNEFADLLNKAGFDLVQIHEKQFRAAGASRIVQARAR